MDETSVFLASLSHGQWSLRSLGRVMAAITPVASIGRP